MKAIRVFAVLMLLAAVGITSMNAQALVKTDFGWTLRTYDGIYPAVSTMAVFTPSGNILHKQEFIIDLDDSIVPEKGVNKVAFITRVLYNGVIHEMYSAEGKVYPDGKVYIVFHENGSGTDTP